MSTDGHGAVTPVGAGTTSEAHTGPVQSAAARLDALIDRWSTTEPGAQLTELVRVRGLLGVGPVVTDVDGGDDLLLAAAARCEAAANVAQVFGGDAQTIVTLRRMGRELSAWLGAYQPTAQNEALRRYAVTTASALVTGQE
jgi:hypothetical protein